MHLFFILILHPFHTSLNPFTQQSTLLITNRQSPLITHSLTPSPSPSPSLTPFTPSLDFPHFDWNKYFFDSSVCFPRDDELPFTQKQCTIRDSRFAICNIQYSMSDNWSPTLILSFFHSSICPFIQSFIQRFTHSFKDSFIHWLNHKSITLQCSLIDAGKAASGKGSMRSRSSSLAPEGWVK
jgi:hypothetical protein